MTRRSITALALAGSCLSASAQTIRINADVTNAVVGGTITWTISVTGLTAAQFVQAYDFNIVASDPFEVVASDFSTNLSALVNPTAGTPSGASILAVSGGQSTLIDPLGTTFGDVVLGTFSTVRANFLAGISYALSDGGVLGAPLIRVRQGSDLGPIVLEGDDFDIVSDRLFGPTPGALAVFALGSLAGARRKRA